MAIRKLNIYYALALCAWLRVYVTKLFCKRYNIALLICRWARNKGIAQKTGNTREKKKKKEKKHNNKFDARVKSKRADELTI